MEAQLGNDDLGPGDAHIGNLDLPDHATVSRYCVACELHRPHESNRLGATDLRQWMLVALFGEGRHVVLVSMGRGAVARMGVAN